jgi:GPH family glycoside/pentoside/hexuronide:cation symporter
MKKRNESLTPLRKLGYESGIGSESITYNMFYVYFMLFLTTVAGINPVLAGTISLISVMVDAVTDPLIGWFCDRPGVDMKKYMLIGGTTMGILLGLTFLVVPGSQAVKFIYYTLISSLMWVSYTLFCIPYYACVTQMTDDYDELTKIRGVSSTMNALFIYIGAALPSVFVGVYTGLFNEHTAWTVAAFSIGALSIIFGLINHFSIKDVKFIEKPALHESDKLIATYIDLLRMKPMRWFIPWVFFMLFATAISTANVEYVIIYTAGLPATVITQTSVMTVICFLVGSPILTFVATKWDRKHAVIAGYVLCIAGLLIVKMKGISTLLDIFVLQGVTGLAGVGFWCFFYDFSYDIIELDEYKNHKSRAGCITSFPQLIQKTGNAVGLQAMGLALALVGFNAAKETQSASTLVGLENISTIFVAVCLLISLFCIIKYPINKKTYAKLQEANTRRRAGDTDFTDPDLERIL